MQQAVARRCDDGLGLRIDHVRGGFVEIEPQPVDPVRRDALHFRVHEMPRDGVRITRREPAGGETVADQGG
jgi:hypothetical protein